MIRVHNSYYLDFFAKDIKIDSIENTGGVAVVIFLMPKSSDLEAGLEVSFLYGIWFFNKIGVMEMGKGSFIKLFHVFKISLNRDSSISSSAFHVLLLLCSLATVTSEKHNSL